MGQIFWDNYLLRTEGKPGPNIWGVKGFTEFHVVPKLKLFALSAGKCLMAGNGCRHLSSMATCSCISSHGSLLVLGFIHWDVVGHREGIFFMCRLCALHYVCVFVCWCYWLPRPALLCNAKLIWPVVFLSGKLLHFSCNPSQWRSYWELKPVPTEQCAVHMNRQHACVSVCVCVWSFTFISLAKSNCAKAQGLGRGTLLLPPLLPFLPLFLHKSPFQLTVQSFSSLSFISSPSPSPSPNSLRDSPSSWWGRTGSVQEEVGCPSANSFKAPFPPRHKVSCILKHSIVSAAPPWCFLGVERLMCI